MVTLPAYRNDRSYTISYSDQSRADAAPFIIECTAPGVTGLQNGIVRLLVGLDAAGCLPFAPVSHLEQSLADTKRRLRSIQGMLSRRQSMVADQERIIEAAKSGDAPAKDVIRRATREMNSLMAVRNRHAKNVSCTTEEIKGITCQIEISRAVHAIMDLCWKRRLDLQAEMNPEALLAVRAEEGQSTVGDFLMLLGLGLNVLPEVDASADDTIASSVSS